MNLRTQDLQKNRKIETPAMNLTQELDPNALFDFGMFKNVEEAPPVNLWRTSNVEEDHFAGEYGERQSGVASCPPYTHKLPDAVKNNGVYQNEIAPASSVVPYGSNAYEAPPPVTDTNIPKNVNELETLTDFVNTNPNAQVPRVEAVFFDNKTCSICGKQYEKGIKRHIRTHYPTEFYCQFPKPLCNSRSRSYNRFYELKLHLLSKHFQPADPAIFKKKKLKEKKELTGTCICGKFCSVEEWFSEHVFVDDPEKRCLYLQ